MAWRFGRVWPVRPHRQLWWCLDGWGLLKRRTEVNWEFDRPVHLQQQAQRLDGCGLPKRRAESGWKFDQAQISIVGSRAVRMLGLSLKGPVVLNPWISQQIYQRFRNKGNLLTFVKIFMLFCQFLSVINVEIGVDETVRTDLVNIFDSSGEDPADAQQIVGDLEQIVVRHLTYVQYFP